MWTSEFVYRDDWIYCSVHSTIRYVHFLGQLRYFYLSLRLILSIPKWCKVFLLSLVSLSDTPRNDKWRWGRDILRRLWKWDERLAEIWVVRLCLYWVWWVTRWRRQLSAQTDWTSNYRLSFLCCWYRESNLADIDSWNRYIKRKKFGRSCLLYRRRPDRWNSLGRHFLFCWCIFRRKLYCLLKESARTGRFRDWGGSLSHWSSYAASRFCPMIGLI